MKLQDQVVNLELSKRLKELGVKQESYFKYEERESGHFEIYHSKPTSCAHKYYSAFTVAEVGDMLPRMIVRDKVSYFLSIYKSCDDDFVVSYDGYIGNKLYAELSHNEVDARASMLIYLLENGLIKNE